MRTERFSLEEKTLRGEKAMNVEPFHQALSRQGLRLERGPTTTLQINLGSLCNQSCGHCHLNAGPDSKDNMNWETANEVIAYAKRSHFETVDITGGAPELNPNLAHIIEEVSPFIPKVMIRSNLSVLNEVEQSHLLALFKKHRVVIVASFPSLNERQTESQRGKGIFNKSLNALKKLNALGYGHGGPSLELNLVSNPTGAFLPSPQSQTEERFRQTLDKKWGIVFNNLFTFANVPMGRFRDWLFRSGNLEKYMERLSSSFNPCALEKVMCRMTVSVSWDGYLYDCDFNLAQGLYMGGRKIHIAEMSGSPEVGDSISVADHCYTCTAGSGFT